jgi:hydrogenase small subunit
MATRPPAPGTDAARANAAPREAARAEAVPRDAARAEAVPRDSREPIAEGMRRLGIDRRTLLRWSAYMAGVLALPAIPFGARIAHALETQPRLPVLWLNGQDCTGDLEALLRASNPTPSQLILDRLSLDYVETLMAPAGQAAEARIADTVARYPGRYVVVVEGSIPTAQGGMYCCVGGRTFAQILTDAAKGALAVLAAGSCAADGGLPKAAGGVTGAASVATVLADTGATILRFPGCPINGDNLTAALVQYLTLGAWPETDASGLPLFAYGSRIHPRCERLPYFRAGQYARSWGDAGHQAGWCLRYLGCQGQRTSGNCPTVKFNSATSWPVSAGAPCLGCTRAGWFDHLSDAFVWTPPAVAGAPPAVADTPPTVADAPPALAARAADRPIGGRS